LPAKTEKLELIDEVNEDDEEDEEDMIMEAAITNALQERYR
jgi:hypothetical protein